MAPLPPNNSSGEDHAFVIIVARDNLLRAFGSISNKHVSRLREKRENCTKFSANYLITKFADFISHPFNVRRSNIIRRHYVLIGLRRTVL